VTDTSLIGRDGRTDGRVCPFVAVTTLNPVDAGILADHGVLWVDQNDLEVLVHGILVDPVRVENPQSSQLAPYTTLIRTPTLQPISESTASTSAPCTGTHQRSSRLQPSPPSPYQHPTNNHDSRACDPLPPPPSLPRNPSHCSSRCTPGGDLV
jgi:hypothetical protein